MAIDYGHNAKALKYLREWSDSNLPVYGSYIGYDLAIQILHRCSCEDGCTLKDIYYSLSHSEPQLRRKLRTFEADGWIYLGKSRRDQRNSLVSPTEKMIAVYDQYFLLMSQVCGDMKLN